MLTRARRYRSLAAGNFVQGASLGVVQLLLGLVSAGLGALIAGFGAARCGLAVPLFAGPGARYLESRLCGGRTGGLRHSPAAARFSIA